MRTKNPKSSNKKLKWSIPKLGTTNKNTVNPVRVIAPNSPGIYEIGTYNSRNGKFSPKYLGSSVKSVKGRIQAHLRHRGNILVSKKLKHKSLAYRWKKSKTPRKDEALLLQKEGIGENGKYKFNRRLEYNNQSRAKRNSPLIIIITISTK